jgi:hypothetical protein
MWILHEKAMAKLWQMLNGTSISDKMMGFALNSLHTHANFAWLSQESHRRAAALSPVIREFHDPAPPMHWID